MYYVLISQREGKMDESFMWISMCVDVLCFVVTIRFSSFLAFFFSFFLIIEVIIIEKFLLFFFLFVSFLFYAFQSENIFTHKVRTTINFHHFRHYDKKYWVSLLNRGQWFKIRPNVSREVVIIFHYNRGERKDISRILIYWKMICRGTFSFVEKKNF